MKKEKSKSKSKMNKTAHTFESDRSFNWNAEELRGVLATLMQTSVYSSEHWLKAMIELSGMIIGRGDICREDGEIPYNPDEHKYCLESLIEKSVKYLVEIAMRSGGRCEYHTDVKMQTSKNTYTSGKTYTE